MSRCSQAIMPSASSTVLGLESAAAFPGALGFPACVCFGVAAGAASGVEGIDVVDAMATHKLPPHRREPRSGCVQNLCRLGVGFPCLAECAFFPAGAAA